MNARSISSKSTSFGAVCERSSVLTIQGANFDNALSLGIEARDGATIDAQDVSAQNCGQHAVRCLRASTCNIAGANLDGTTSQQSILAVGACKVEAKDASVVRSTVSQSFLSSEGSYINARNTDVGSGVYAVSNGGIIAAAGTTGTITPSAALNSVTASGIIFR